MEDYNLLTQKLLAEGYTAENHPDYVRIPSGWNKDDRLENLHHGFEYTRKYRDKLVFETGCGLLVAGSDIGFGSMSYMGILWIPENNNPVICCPYRKDTCDKRNPILGGPSGGALAKIFQCDCHLTDKPYAYDISVKRIRDDINREKRQKYDEFSDRVKGHVCYWHMRYNDWTGEWKQKYNPMDCARHCTRVGGICDLRHTPVSKKKGNVFYDVKVSYIRRDGTLFDGEKVVKINKGMRLFETGKSITICEEVVKRCKKDIIRKEMNRLRYEIRFRGWKVEVLNIRAERRESRDLMQDLQDIREGIEVVHVSDLNKAAKAAKKEHRQQAQQKKIAKLEKKILEVGYDSLEEYCLDRIHADKWLGEERIAELEQERQKRSKQKEEMPVQMSLFDLGVMS